MNIKNTILALLVGVLIAPSFIFTQAVTASTSTYRYDHLGNRVSETVDGVTTLYPNKFYSTNGTTTTKYIYAGDELIATVEKVGTTTTTHAIHTDHLRGTNVITDQEGNVVQTLDYYPFGEIRNNTHNTGFDVKRKYTGHEYDVATGLNYMQARYQDPTRGQFLSQDSMFWGNSNLSDPQGANSYSYARNNPILMVDRGGKYFETAFDIAMFSLSVNDFRKNPSFGNAIGMGADAFSVALPIPAFVGGLRHADDAGMIVKNVLGRTSDIMESSRALGKAGEEASGIVKNTERIPSLTGTANYRIPDQLDHTAKVVGEVKNVNYLGLTSQMQDFTSFAQKANYNLDLYVRPTTKISQPLAKVLADIQATIKQLEIKIKDLGKIK